MLVADGPDAYRLVTQPEHADQVGRIAEAWGGEGFETADPETPAVMAAYLHDAGWWEYDLGPHLGPGGRPVDLLETDRESWTSFYESGIDWVADRDRYAGLLASLHGAGVRRERYGTQPEMPDYTAEFGSFVDREEHRQRGLLSWLTEHRPLLVDDADHDALEALHRSGSYGGESRLWRNYRLLQAWDRLSLYCCTRWTPVEATIGPVPVGPDTPDTTLTLTPLDGQHIQVDPFPFRDDTVSLPVRARTIPVRSYDGTRDLAWAYYEARRDSVDVSFVRAA